MQLDSLTQARYRKKLEAVGLSLSDDPYSVDDRFRSDMIRWPKIVYGHIFAYFITRPGTYTQEKLLSWNQLKAYNYFLSGYMTAVLSRELGNGKTKGVILKAKVNPGQRSSDNAYEAWIISRLDGQIVCLHCSCMAG